MFFRFLLARPALTAAVLELSPLVLVRLFVWLGSLKIKKFGIRSALSHEELIKMADDYKRCSSNVVYYPRSVSEKLVNYRDVNVPTLLIWGKEDRVLSVAGFKKLCRELPKVTFREINAGLYPHRSNPEEVNASILEF
jgi:pimeloyl-ACP methyl ester carboxylesterase